MRRFLILFSALLMLFSVSPKVFADTPTFPACANPMGSIVANYPNGTHGIVGNTNSFTGKDTVYSVSPNQYTQCFCPNNGDGVQTNWLNAKSLTQDQIDIYTHIGWIFVPDGSAWGLSSDPYLAQNSPFACSATANGGNTGGHGDGLSDGRSDGKSDGKSDPVSVLGAASSILNLANTGNIIFIIATFGIGILFTALGLFFKRFNR